MCCVLLLLHVLFLTCLASLSCLTCVVSNFSDMRCESQMSYSFSRNMMSLGFSKSWPEALESMTGSPEMSARSFIKYFLPLYQYLEQENSANGECIGWGSELVGLGFVLGDVLLS